MLFGKKKDAADNVAIKTSPEVTIEKLFEAIKDMEFEAGKPELCKKGIAFRPYLTFDYKIIIMGEAGDFHCTYTTSPLDGGDVAFNLVDGALDALLGTKKKLDRTLGDEDKAKYGNLNNAIAIKCADCAAKVNALAL